MKETPLEKAIRMNESQDVILLLKRIEYYDRRCEFLNKLRPAQNIEIIYHQCLT